MARQSTPAMESHAELLIARSHKWCEGTRHRDGLKTYQFCSSREKADGTYDMYIASELGCTCPSHRHRGQCAHVTAIKRVAERTRSAVGPRRASYSELFPPDEYGTVSAF